MSSPNTNGTGVTTGGMTCPECGQTLSGADQACSHCGFGSVNRNGAADGDELPRGARIGGGILMFMAVLGLIGFALGARSHGLFNPIGPALLDLWVGSSLARGSRKLLGFAKFRVIAGAIVYGGLFLGKGNPIAAVGQVAYSLALCGLLFGRAGKVRIRIAAGITAITVLLTVLGFQQTLTGHNLLTAAIQRTTLRLQPIGKDPVHGTVGGYSIGPLPSRWKLMNRKQARKTNAAVDLWFVDTAHDAGILVIPEIVSDPAQWTLDRFQESVLARVKKNVTGIELLAQRTAVLNGHPVRLLDIGSTLNGIEVRYRFGLFLQDALAVQVICIASKKAFTAVEDDFQRAIESIVTEPPAHPPAAESAPPGAKVACLASPIFALVPVQKRRFLAAPMSGCGFTCAAYQSPPRRESLAS